ncbi:MAG: hypothetical protein R3F34_03095 [Planctomycetota bacterium]
MRTLALALLTFISLAVGTARAQDTMEDYQRIFKEGIDALEGGRYDDGIASFRRCLELNPEDAVCAYNIACGYSMKGSVDDGITWLGHSADWGFGLAEGNIEHAETKDTDLANLRADARFADCIGRMKETKKRLDEYLAKPAAEWAPESRGDGPVGLLVVLHDNGSTRDDVVSGPWRRVAEELGFVLVAPSGRIAARVDPADGMSWMPNFGEYQQRYWIYEKPVQDAVSAARKKYDVDRSRIYVAGAGDAGIVAMNIAIGSPGLFKGVVTLDAPVVEQLVQEKAPNAGKMGLRARLLWSDRPNFLEGQEVTREDYASYLGQRFSGWSVDASIDRLPARPAERAEGEDEAAAKAREEAETAWIAAVADAVRDLVPAPAEPVEAGAGK